MPFQRDSFIEAIFNEAKKDKDIFFLSADFGAPSLDKFREELPDQFIHCGISEQNMVDVAAGLALDNRKVYIYAMAPFVGLRCLEQHKCATGLMKLPVCTIVAGIGLGYADAGPTHYSTEDLACLRALVNSNVYTASDANVSELIAKYLIENPEYSFVRLDRDTTDNIGTCSLQNITDGYRDLVNNNNKLLVISHGIILNRIFEVINENKLKADLVDLIKSKPISDSFLNLTSKYEKILVIDEQTASGNLSAAIFESIANTNLNPKIKTMNLYEKYYFENGGRDYLLDIAGLNKHEIKKNIIDNC